MITGDHSIDHPCLFSGYSSAIIASEHYYSLRTRGTEQKMREDPPACTTYRREAGGLGFLSSPDQSFVF